VTLKPVKPAVVVPVPVLVKPPTPKSTLAVTLKPVRPARLKRVRPVVSEVESVESDGDVMSDVEGGDTLSFSAVKRQKYSGEPSLLLNKRPRDWESEEEEEKIQLPASMRLKKEYADAALLAAAAEKPPPPPLRQRDLPEEGWNENYVGGAKYRALKGVKQPAVKPLVAYPSSLNDNVDIDCLSADLHHLSVKDLSGTEFQLQRLERSNLGLEDKKVKYDPSLKEKFAGSPHFDDRWCVNNPSTKPTARFRSGYLLINTAVKDATEVLCSTQSLELTFGGDAVMLSGPALQLGTRWNKLTSKIQAEDVKAGAFLPLASTSDLAEERVFDPNTKDVTMQTFLAELWFQPNFFSNTVSLYQIKESRTVGGKRLIYRQHKDACWEAVKLETPIVLTDGCSFYLEDPAIATHSGCREYPRRPEIFTFVCELKHPLSTGKLADMDRLYRYTITRHDVVVLPIEEERSVLLDVINEWPTSEVKKAWGKGVKNFNTYFRHFGFEYVGRVVSPENERILRYEAITVDMARAPPQSKRSGFATYDTRTHDQRFFWAIFEYLYRRYPKKHWVILQVTGEGNCLFHCLAAWFAVMYPDRTYLHFYDWLRQQLCDMLDEHIDVLKTPRNRNIGWLELFQQLTEQSGDPADKDLRGLYPPTQTLEERRFATEKENAAFRRDKKAYEDRCVRNRQSIRSKYENAVIVGRQNCEFNTPMQLEALPVLVDHILNVGVFADARGYGEISPEINRHLPYKIETHEGEDKMIHIFLDPQTKAQHYVSVVEARFVSGFETPADEPKNTQTHDERGLRRPVVSAKYKNYKR
jgi:hypothetical protein